MIQANRETQLNSVLSDLISTVLEVYGGNDICPICGGENVGDAAQVLGFNHDETCSLVSAIALCELESPSPYSLEQGTGITPQTLREALYAFRFLPSAVLSVDLYDIGQEWEGVIVHTPEHSWVIGIHGDDPEWDANGYLDWSMYTTGTDPAVLQYIESPAYPRPSVDGTDRTLTFTAGDTHLYLDEYLGMGVANDSKGWSLEKMLWKIGQVVLTGEIQQDLSGPIVAPCTFTCVHCADHFCHDNCPRCESLWVAQMERDHNTQ